MYSQSLHACGLPVVVSRHHIWAIARDLHVGRSFEIPPAGNMYGTSSHASQYPIYLLVSQTSIFEQNIQTHVEPV